MTAAGPELITTEAELVDVVSAAGREPAYAIDTEFHRERTYFPKVALVQLAWADQLVLIDPLATGLEPLDVLVRSDSVAVLHAAQQDLEVLERACGHVPSILFDTQLAAGFVGMRSPSLAAVLDRLLGVRLPKGDRLTDWLARPLTETQLDYAADDVRYLLDVHTRLVDDLRGRERLQWAEDECEALRQRTRVTREPDDAWRRIKESRHLNRRGRGVARSVGAWRERRAIEVDQPPRFILPDLAVVGIAQRPPRNIEQLRKVRGIDDRHTKGRMGDEILAAVGRGLDADVAPPSPTRAKMPSEQLRPAVTLLSAWITQHAADLDLDPALLGTRHDIEAFLRGDAGARLSEGWRKALAGGPLQDLLEGRAALAFESGRLVLDERPGSADPAVPV